MGQLNRSNVLSQINAAVARTRTLTPHTVAGRFRPYLDLQVRKLVRIKAQ